MNLTRLFHSLYSELARVNAAIAALEKLDTSESGPLSLSRSGRKEMGHAERKQVPERMKRSWAARRSQQGG